MRPQKLAGAAMVAAMLTSSPVQAAGPGYCLAQCYHQYSLCYSMLPGGPGVTGGFWEMGFNSCTLNLQECIATCNYMSALYDAIGFLLISPLNGGGGGGGMGGMGTGMGAMGAMGNQAPVDFDAGQLAVHKALVGFSREHADALTSANNHVRAGLALLKEAQAVDGANGGVDGRAIAALVNAAASMAGTLFADPHDGLNSRLCYTATAIGAVQPPPPPPPGGFHVTRVGPPVRASDAGLTASNAQVAALLRDAAMAFDQADQAYSNGLSNAVSWLVWLESEVTRLTGAGQMGADAAQRVVATAGVVARAAESGAALTRCLVDPF